VAVRYPGQEPYLNPPAVEISDPQGVGYRFWLQTSPEFAMKKLLAAGFQKIFQLARCFRNQESFGGRHNPEFTLLEWYRSPGQVAEIMNDTEQLFQYLAGRLDREKIIYNGQEICLSGVWDRVSMKEIWHQYVGVNLDDYLTAEKMAELVRARGFSAGSDEPYEDLFYQIFLNAIEPKLGLAKPVFIYDYPAQMCSLSRLCGHDNRYAERFELYVGGLELANGFGELTDAAEQSKRLEEDKNKRQKLGKEIWPVDPDFIKALETWKIEHGSSMGIKQSGIALGVDRMILLFTGAKDLNEVIFGSINDQINK
jgi:lysyl-tRNA synthetase class 2